MHFNGLELSHLTQQKQKQNVDPKGIAVITKDLDLIDVEVPELRDVFSYNILILCFKDRKNQQPMAYLLQSTTIFMNINSIWLHEVDLESKEVKLGSTPIHISQQMRSWLDYLHLSEMKS